ncbi:phage tail protein [Moraxella catarrhalis]|uniref:phage tail protein n=1 Tax=Moraxella catarrhalis TaxID=480 RepID=UPI00207108C4|nr:phage tail protein [Moraxella catarrhalis]DAF40071.1 MAG TPA: minor tail protein [Caudoviricetes sp.]
MKTFTWDISADSSETTALNTTITAFGDDYEQAVSFGINNSRKSWQCSKTDTKAVIDEIYRFLIDTKGVEPFNFKPLTDEPSIKVRLDGEISRQKTGGRCLANWVYFKAGFLTQTAHLMSGFLTRRH